MTETPNLLEELNDRSREVFRRVVEGYLESGEPVGSRTLTRTMSEKVSAATVRNVMQDLEYLGLLDSPHVSAGRIPTQVGLRMFVDGFLEIGDLSEGDKERLDSTLGGNTSDVSSLLDRVGSALSGVTQGASLVLAPKHEAPIKHIEFVGLGPDRALVVLVFADGHVENRVFSPPPGQTPSSMREAANFLNAMLEGAPSARSATSSAPRSPRAGRRSISSRISWCRAASPSGARTARATRASSCAGGRTSWARRPTRPTWSASACSSTTWSASATSRSSSSSPTRARGAHLHRLGEQTFFLVGFLSGGLPIYERGPEDRRRRGRDRAHAAQLRPHRSDRGLHGATGRAASVRPELEVKDG